MTQTSASTPIRVAIVGWGAIARSEHAAALAADQGFEVVAVVSPETPRTPWPCYEDLDSLLKAGVKIDAVSICTPPGPRFTLARTALLAGLHVLLEKPPAATAGQARLLEKLARQVGRTVMAAWHSRQARSVEAARAWLGDRTILDFQIDWREDVHRWHPGQDWIWRAPGLGVMDPGINALSILTHILPADIAVTDAALGVFGGHETPIAAWLELTTETCVTGRAHFDWREADDQVWRIIVDTDQGQIQLSEGGAYLVLPGQAQSPSASQALTGEYAGLYRRFSNLIATGESEVDARPLALAADAFLCGRRLEVAWPRADR